MELDDAIPVPSTSTGTKMPLKTKATRTAAINTPAAKKATTNQREWRHTDLSNRQKQRFPWNRTVVDISKMPTSPVDLFECFFDQELLETFAEFSKTYARSKGNMTFATTSEELKTFLAILLLSGYSPVPRRRMYWSSDEDVGKDAVQAAMSRNRFDEMMRYFHVSDNTLLDATDKMSKVRPLLTYLNEKFLAYFRIVQTQDLSIDESMVKYFGRHSCKQFIRGKPIRFGYKVWMLSTSLGYVVQFEPYQGASGRQAEYPDLGKGGSIVLDLIAELQEEEGRAYHLTFDNMFTSLKLVDVLTEKNIACTGTIRSNRLENCPVKDVTEMKKTARGTFDHATDPKTGFTVVRWNDNNIVNVVSNKVGVNPIQTTKRWSRAESKHVTIPQPFMINHYNHTMGGVDRTDQNVGTYRTVIRCKKWWWPIFSYCLDLSIQQAWHLYRETDAARGNPLDLLAIRRTVARVYLSRAGHAGPGRPTGFVSLDRRVLPEVRFDRLDHLVQSWPTQLRCGSCGKKTMRRCAKCKVGLHDMCFQQYHTR